MITIKEATERYGVPRRTLDEWGNAGRLPTHKFPRDRKTYILPEDIERILAEEPPTRGRPARWRKPTADNSEELSENPSQGD